MQKIMPSSWPLQRPKGLLEVWQDRDFLAQVFEPANGGQRISVNRVKWSRDSKGWLDGLTWDDLMFVKREIGFGDRWAVEVFPPEAEIINVANMRHLWLLPEKPSFAWAKKVEVGRV